MKINWLVRIKNPLFWVQIGIAILMPILAYLGLSVEDLTTWGKVGQVLLEAVANPYVLGLVIVSVFNAIQDPTTKGLSDSVNALTYTEPK
ncbi:MAG: phage holin [Bacilli bacterium]|nr:phage holin [Bacilli bacterium]